MELEQKHKTKTSIFFNKDGKLNIPLISLIITAAIAIIIIVILIIVFSRKKREGFEVNVDIQGKTMSIPDYINSFMKKLIR